MVLDIHDKCADPSPRFTDTVRREKHRHEAQQIFKDGGGGHITREYSLYICTELQGVSMDRKYVPGICMKVWSGGSRLFRIDINR